VNSAIPEGVETVVTFCVAELVADPPPHEASPIKITESKKFEINFDLKTLEIV
jgi:hypothetical protein